MCPGQQALTACYPTQMVEIIWVLAPCPATNPQQVIKPIAPQDGQNTCPLFSLFFFSQVYFLSPLNHFAFIITQASASLHRLPISSHRHPISGSQTLPRKTVPGQKKRKKKSLCYVKSTNRH